MITPAVSFDFTSTSLDARITFTRALNTATRVNASGFTDTVNADVARVDYDPVMLACKGLLVEESRQTVYSTVKRILFKGHTCMTPQDYINIIFGTAATIIGWLGRELWQAIKELRADLSKLREELPTRYVPKNEFQQFSGAIFKKLDRIEDKIDKKLDKESYHG